MPRLSQLYLASNDIHHTLPAVMSSGTDLRVLSLANNQIYGTIPLSFQEIPWHNLDLSHNQLSGTLDSNFCNSSTYNGNISLSNNRLSGDIPVMLINSNSSLDILSGNIFYCDYSTHGLPLSDKSYDKYTCGSNSFDLTAYVWLGCFLIAGILVILLLPMAALEDGRELFDVLLSLCEEFVFIMGPPPAPKEESSFIFFIDKFEY
jgi:hypothetical protein